MDKKRTRRITRREQREDQHRRLDELEARALKKVKGEGSGVFRKRAVKATRLEMPCVTEADLEDSKDDLQLEGLVTSMFAAGLCLALTSCCHAPGFVPAVRRFEQSVTPAYLNYVQQDQGLNDMQKASRADNVAALRAALDEAEAE